VPLPRHDEQPLPSRRALRQAERARAASSASDLTPAPTAAAVVESAPTGPVPTGPVAAPPPSRRAMRSRERAATPVPVPAPAGPVVVPPAAPAVEQVVADHVLEGGDDVWVEGIAPRPTPVASRVVDEPAPTPAAGRNHGSAWRRVPQMLVVGSLVAATAGYAATSDITATAGSVPQFVREEAVVDADSVDTAALAADLGDGGSSLVAGEDGLLRVRDDEQASRSGERTLLPGCDGVPPETPQANGQIDRAYLCTLWDGKTEIRADAAVSLALLNEQYRAQFGTDICMTDGYRSYGAQAALRARKPGLAARAGTSEHGYGLAVDMCGGVESAGAAYWWLMENAGEFGFENPAWAQRGGGGPYEPWHWEYVAGQW
jgi:zinc D-Ala-D-Ala carboxypeptidase